MTSSVSVHIVNPNDVVLKLIQDAQGLQGEYESFGIFVDDNDKGNNCDFDNRDTTTEKSPRKLDITDWFPSLQTFRTGYSETIYTAIHLQTPDDLQRAVAWLNLDPLKSWFAREVDNRWVGGVVLGESVAPLGEWIVVSPNGIPEIWSTSMIKSRFPTENGVFAVAKRPKKVSTAIKFNMCNSAHIASWARTNVKDGHVVSSVQNSEGLNQIILVSRGGEHIATIDHRTWFVATGNGELKLLSESEFDNCYVKEIK